jgi:hypothetical protein
MGWQVLLVVVESTRCGRTMDDRGRQASDRQEEAILAHYLEEQPEQLVPGCRRLMKALGLEKGRKTAGRARVGVAPAQMASFELVRQGKKKQAGELGGASA